MRHEAARLVAENLTAADPTHPWTGMRFAAAWRSQEMMDVILVHPDLVAEISADTAIDHGGLHRHTVRFKRLRLDGTAVEVPLFTTTPATESDATRPDRKGASTPRSLAARRRKWPSNSRPPTPGFMVNGPQKYLGHGGSRDPVTADTIAIEDFYRRLTDWLAEQGARGLRDIQYRSHLIDGCLAATGLPIRPTLRGGMSPARPIRHGVGRLPGAVRHGGGARGCESSGGGTAKGKWS
ncbi:hypothetical protein ACFV1H_23140 [Streptomyces virginiae]|uniref:hypothetical protein n=1 Tax=Streptomyces virginiae TaxID=1961 RepID=UPI0036C82262